MKRKRSGAVAMIGLMSMAACAPVEPASQPAPPQPVAVPGASIAGAIRAGNRPPPALRVCASPFGGGTPACVETTAGATSYRLALAPGRYIVRADPVDGGESSFMHASRIRCIRAPCPPDTLIEVELAAGEEKTGIDLSMGRANLPEGWSPPP